jgi:HEPN domain-containing protein
VEARVKIYLEDARRFLEEAEQELAEGVRESNAVKIRDAAEKAWNAVVQATNALILRLLGKVPSSHFERRKMLTRLEELYPEVERLGLRDRYSARERNLHELVFYEGIIDVEEVRRELEKARRYVDDVERLLAA